MLRPLTRTVRFWGDRKMNSKQKKVAYRIIVAAALAAVILILELFVSEKFEWFMLIPYIIAGYDVLINHREKAEFVPSSRLNEVVAQRETFKTQAEQAIIELNKLKGQQGMSEEAQNQINTLIGQNETLLEQLKETNIQVEIMSSASDAINPKDVLPFIDMSKIKQDKEGNVVGGVKEEVDRIRAEKPYLFNKQQENPNSKGGFDGSGGNGGTGNVKTDMNAAIRRAAFGGSRSF